MEDKVDRERLCRGRVERSLNSDSQHTVPSQRAISSGYQVLSSAG